jgi:hypothetical protein
MVMLEPDTLYAQHMGDYDMIYDVPREEATCIFASGTFPMPEMINHAQREAEQKKQEDITDEPDDF